VPLPTWGRITIFLVQCALRDANGGGRSRESSPCWLSAAAACKVVANRQAWEALRLKYADEFPHIKTTLTAKIMRLSKYALSPRSLMSRAEMKRLNLCRTQVGPADVARPLLCRHRACHSRGRRSCSVVSGFDLDPSRGSESKGVYVT
jgi:hypothetical protein